MQFKTLAAALALATLSLAGQAPAQEPQAAEAKGLPPRVSPTDYQAQAKAGNITIGAEFMAHGVPTPQAVFSSEDYVVVEIGIFGPPASRAKISSSDFSLRINGKKQSTPSQSVEAVFRSLKDPEWEPPKTEAKSKTSFGGGGGGADNSPPPVVHMPMDLRHAMEQKTLKAALPEGDRALPQAGLLFFQYRGKPDSIHSLDLIYSGAAGNATLALQP